MDTSVLFKYRSVTACMKASYDLMSQHLTSFFKKTWWAMLIYAIFIAFTVYFRLPNKALHDWGESSPWSSYILQTCIYLGVWVMGIVSSAAVWTWLKKKFRTENENTKECSKEKLSDNGIFRENEKSENDISKDSSKHSSHCSFKKTLIRFAIVSILFEVIFTLVVGGFCAGISSFYSGYTAPAAEGNPMIQVGAADSTAQMGMAGNSAAGMAGGAAGMAADSTGTAHQAIANGAAADGSNWMTNGAIGCILAVVLIALMLLVSVPFANIIPKVMLKEDGEKWSLWKGYKMGLRHFGGIFKMGFLGSVILAIILFVVCIPAFILSWAQMVSQLGALNGDPLGVPALFPILTLIVFILTALVICYAITWLNISFAYFYGANKTMEEKKLEANQ